MSIWTEFYVIEKTIDLVVQFKATNQTARIRIEALREEFVSPPVYSTRAYIQEHLTLQPTYPANNNGPTSPPQDYSLWVDYDLPWTSESTADLALIRATAWLGERCIDQP